MTVVHIPGLAYSGETEEQVRRRDEAIEAHNRKWTECACTKCGFMNPKEAFKTLVPLLLKCPSCGTVGNIRHN